MEIENYIPANQFCEIHKIDITFINSLNELGLLTFVIHEEVSYIEKEKINELEKMIRLHYDLDINAEGIEAISHLLQKVNSLQEEVKFLKNKINFFESE
ncbi:MAG: chaperone modulator CbpM [Bacteroidota bacterium]|nr:chaperone modulator CbpM [Bacteroidota bacterium]MDP3144643.1 chaperone modulator CbpM [Bacteroidota bacterium]